MAARRERLSGVVVVWTDENRARYDRRGQRYPSDITDAEWVILEPLLPVAQGCGRPRVHGLCVVGRLGAGGGSVGAAALKRTALTGGVKNVLAGGVAVTSVSFAKM